MSKNVLAVRSTPKYEFVVPRHAAEFEKEILDIYYDDVKNGKGFWGQIPSIEMGIAAGTCTKYMFAGLLANAHDDPDYYHNYTEGKLIPEYEPIWCGQNLAAQFANNPELKGQLYGAIVRDCLTTLDFHNMCYGVRLDTGWYPGTGLQGFSNIPVKEVW